jgi:hypothetical protein
LFVERNNGQINEMLRTRNILRLVYFLLAIVLLAQLNRKAEGNAQSVAEFKFKMFHKLKRDSLDYKHKLDLLINETTKFVDDSAHVQEKIHYLMALLAVLMVTEIVFFVVAKRNSR